MTELKDCLTLKELGQDTYRGYVGGVRVTIVHRDAASGNMVSSWPYKDKKWFWTYEGLGLLSIGHAKTLDEAKTDALTQIKHEIAVKKDLKQYTVEWDACLAEIGVATEPDKFCHHQDDKWNDLAKGIYWD